MRHTNPFAQPPAGPPAARFFGSAMAVCKQTDVGREIDLVTQPMALQTEAELWQWVLDHLGIRIPTEQVCADHVAPFTAFAAAYFAKDPIVVWHASRAFGGKSVLLATLGLTEACTLGAGVTVLGGSGEQSRRVHAYMEGTDTNLPQSFWNAPQAPRYLLKSNLSAWRTSLRNGGWVHALMASQRAVRGPHPQRLRIDECDEVKLDIFDSAMGQPMGAGGVESQTVASSTHQYPDGTMTEIFRRARERNWPCFEWCFRESMAGENGWLEQAEVERKKSTITVAMWETEFELQEPTPEGRAFDKDAVEAMFDPTLGEYPGGEGERYIFEKPTWELDPDWPAVPAWTKRYKGHLQEMGKLRSSRRWRMQNLNDQEHQQWKDYWDRCRAVRKGLTCRYAAGADWGKKRDHTIIWVLRIDCRPRRWVAYANLARRPYPEMFAEFNAFVARFNAQSAHDATGIGNAAEDFMETAMIDLTMVGAARRELFNEYIVAVEDGGIVGPRVKYVYDEHRYTVQDDLWGRGHPPDSVVAGAMANHAAMYGGGLVR